MLQEVDHRCNQSVAWLGQFFLLRPRLVCIQSVTIMSSFRPPKQWVLQETETITSFANWQSNINYHLSLNNDFAPYIEPTFTWHKASTANRGLVSDDTTAVNSKTAAQKNAVLEQMLGLIAQFAPSLLRNDIVKKSTGLKWIWQRIRQHYGFRQSEVNFLNIHKIMRTDGERYETLFNVLCPTLRITCLLQTVKLLLTVLRSHKMRTSHQHANVFWFIYGWHA